MEPKTTSAPPLVCDFCSEPVTEVRTFDVAPLAMKVKKTIVYFCDNRWAACPICAQMIDENRWDELTTRSYETWLQAEHARGAKPDFAFKQFMKTQVSELHQLFREARGRTA
jgi:hypothetical protein